MSDLTKIKIWKVLASSNHFWITTLILYLQYRDLTLAQALTLISVYSMLCVLLEYPTGVIGDYFSHRISVLAGSILSIIMFFLVTFDGSFFYYLFVASFIPALAFTLVSGSDTALLHSVSKDFKKDWAQITPISLFLSAITITTGGLFASVDMRFPFYASFVYAILTIPFLFKLKNYSHTKDEGNIFDTAKNGIKDVLSNKTLRDLTLVTSVFGAFFSSIKWFYNPLFDELKIPVAYWGVIASLAFLLIALGAQIYKKKGTLSLTITSVLTLVAIFLIGITNYWIIPLLGIGLTHIVRGYQDTHLGLLINNEIATNRRASILSFNSLMTRLASSVYIAGVGYMLPKSSFLVMFAFTAIIIGIIIFSPIKRLAHIR